MGLYIVHGAESIVKKGRCRSCSFKARARICTQKVVARDKIKTVQCQKTFPPQRYGHSRWGKEFHEKMVLLFVVLQDDDINAVPDRGVCKQKKG